MIRNSSGISSYKLLWTQVRKSTDVGARQGAFAMHLVDGPLNDEMGPDLKGERAGFLFKLGARQCLFDVAGPCVVPFDQAGVVAIHHADEIGKLGCAVRMQPLSQPGGFFLDLDRKVCQFCRNMLLKDAGFDPDGCF